MGIWQEEDWRQLRQEVNGGMIWKRAKEGHGGVQVLSQAVENMEPSDEG